MVKINGRCQSLGWLLRRMLVYRGAELGRFHYTVCTCCLREILLRALNICLCSSREDDKKQNGRPYSRAECVTVKHLIVDSPK